MKGDNGTLLDIEDLRARVLTSLNQSIERGRPDPRHCDLADITNISERHVRRLLRDLRIQGLVTRERHFRRCIYQITPKGHLEARRIREYFRLS